MVNVNLNLSIFTVFLKNGNFISKIRRPKVTDYAALSWFSQIAAHMCYVNPYLPKKHCS